MNVNITDVTLRDGGYRTNFNFSNQEIETILSLLDASGAEYIEVGYRNGSLKPTQNMGAAGKCNKHYLKKCKGLIRRSKLTVMLHPNNVTRDDIKELADCGVDLVRICIIKNDYKNSMRFVDTVKEYGLSVSANITRVSQYTQKELDTSLFVLNEHDIDMIYLADSNGSMFPEEVESIYKIYTQKYHVPMGFHAHDNLGLAQANSLAAIKSGAQYIDTSLSGFGKGIGNLRMELFASYLNAVNIKKYDIENILIAANFVRNEMIGRHNITMNELLMGINNLSIDEIQKYRKVTTKSLSHAIWL